MAPTTNYAAPNSLPFRSCAPMVLVLVMAASGCANIKPYVAPSEGHISAPPSKAEPDRAIPPPARTSEFVPAPKPAVKPQTYSVVVNEVPVKDLLLALARDTKQNIDIHSGLAGLVSLNAVNETLPAILERVSKQVNLRYRVEGNTILVSPDSPYVKTYRVNYVNMQRDTNSTIGVTGEISTSGPSGASGGGGASTSGSSTVVKSVSINNFWEQLRDNIRAILNSTRLQSLTADAKAERLALVKQEQELRVKQLEAASRAGQGAQTLANSVIPGGSGAGGQQQASLLPDDVVVNPISGTITLNATEKQHQLVQQHVDSIVNAMLRQVLIEATIVEVVLSEKYQGGVDWSRLPIGGGPSLIQNMLGAFDTAPTGGNSFQVIYVNPTSRVGNISGTVQLLQEFGNTRVLSSPKMMALNNQTALLKVVDNVVFFEVTSSTTQGVQGSTLQSFSTTAKTVAVGVVMSVTPQINDDGRVSLTVRPTITRLNPAQPFVTDPNPSLTNPCGTGVTSCSITPVNNQVPQVQVREMESVLQVGSGQTVILGGLMQDGSQRNRQQIPGADALSAAGEIFRFRSETVVKTELVIFLRPTIVTNPSLDSDELRFFQRFLPQPEATPPQPERTGAAR